MSKQIREIEEKLGFTEEDAEALRNLVTLDLLKSAMGITDSQVDLAYEQRIKKELQNVIDTLSKLLE
tara:strand:- start:17068 stop:17268 length:201 start_codon:yes stop_codon:yes gene_type:complete